MFSVHHFSSTSGLVSEGENDSVTNSLRVKLPWSLGTGEKEIWGFKNSKSTHPLQATEVGLLF